MSPPELNKMDHDILRIVRDSECPATSKAITESYYRCETPTGASTVHVRCTSLEKRGLLDSNKELLGETARTTIVWKITDDGRMALREPAKDSHDVDLFFKSDLQKEPEVIAEEKDDRRNITLTGSPVNVSSAPSEDRTAKRELHPETLEYVSGCVDTLHRIEECVNTGRFSEARDRLRDLLNILDPKQFLENIDVTCPQTPDYLIIASDLIRSEI